MRYGIRKIRLKYGMTQQQLAARLQVEVDQISRWERGVEDLPIAVTRDICLVFDCSAGEVLGRKIDVTEWGDSPFAIGSDEERLLFGTLLIKTRSGAYEYPICRKARKSILSQLGKFDHIRERDSSRPWLYCYSMDNKIIHINPSCVRLIRLIDDNDEAAPEHSHPEVFLAVRKKGLDQEAVDDHGIGPLLSAAVDEWIEIRGGEEAAVRETDNIHIIYDDGSDDWSLMIDEWDTVELFGFEGASFHVPANSFVMIQGEPRTFLNMESTAIVEIPAENYHRLCAPEPEEKPQLKIVR